MSSSSRQCEHIRDNGQRCQAYAVENSRFCYWHEPSLAPQRAESRAKGGKARHGRQISYLPSDAPPVALQTPGDVLTVLEGAINDALRLENSLSRSRTIGSLCGTALKAIELTELAARIEALERTVFAEKAGMGNGYFTTTT